MFIFLDYYQKRYTHRLLSLSNLHPTKEILLISLREGDKGFQPREVPKNIFCEQKMRGQLCMVTG